MKPDPLDDVNVRPARRAPPHRGPGSGKQAWIDYALGQAENGVTLWGIIDEQSATIRELQAEIELLRKQIATRKPKGGRPRLSDAKVAEIERDLGAGYSRRQVAVRCGVSAMAVQRVAERMAARQSRYPAGS